ncbi:unnamed protein product [Anisakis simplex]|uniref:SHSP domain-containing protein n=1 Tax=Anisakis simplex TaxID=6269 RepID=A0A0M3K9T1_ANISI|nr:unnamed protein product [Anisakis simplex]
MSTSYNRTSSYNRTYEKRVIEESPRVVISNTMRIPQVATAQIQAPFGSIAGTISSQQSGVEDSFSATIDVSQFKAEDLKVAVIGEFIVVEAKHPEREDELGFVERHFIRSEFIPDIDCNRFHHH